MLTWRMAWRPLILVALFFAILLLLFASINHYLLEKQRFEQQYAQAQAILGLVQGELLRSKEDDWGRRLQELQQAYALDLRLENLSAREIDTPEDQALLAGAVLFRPADGAFYQRVARSAWVLLWLPDDGAAFFALPLFLLLFLALLSPVIWAFGRTQKEARVLANLLDDLANEQNQARAHLPAGSLLLPVAQSLNGAARSLAALADQRKIMIDGISHDLRTPIARLRYRLETLRGAAADNPFLFKLLAQANRDLDSLNAMTEELLIFSRLDRPELNLHPQNVEWTHWLLHLLQECNWQDAMPELQICRDGKTVILNDFDDTIGENGEFLEIFADCDPYYMGRAIGNLLNNAQRYGAGLVAVTLEDAADHLVLHVDDNGAGIPKSARQSVFQPFSRLDAARQGTTGGHGLGLAIVKKVVEAHAGRVEIGDAALGGARMSLILPKILPKNLQKNTQTP